jgi:ABC-type multidrug transport system fused ATPase/permease subunit
VINEQLKVVALLGVFPNSHSARSIWLQQGIISSFKLHIQVQSNLISLLQQLPQEGPLTTKTFGLPSKWPAEGQIEFVGFQLRYSSSSPAVLKGVTFKVRSSEKIGIVGRTGSGDY